jgi:thioredoxin reductase
MTTENKYLIIGTGPCGIGAIRCFSKYNIPFECVESHSDIGGQWDITNPNSTMYQSAHLISSKKVMELSEYPMPDEFADYPHHTKMKSYFDSYIEKFNLKSEIQFNTKVISTARLAPNKWEVELESQGTIEKKVYKGIVVANGIFSKPNRPQLKGENDFTGEIIHSSQYKEQGVFDNKRVLIIGAGNSGCDIAIDAVHRSKYVDMSVRRGYYFVPKYLFGKPSDMVDSKLRLPQKLDVKIKKKILKLFTGDPVNFGFPKPDYDLFESHPIVNSLILFHLGQGDLTIKPDVDYLKDKTVYFKDGTSKEYDLILMATGYKLYYPFIENKHLNWQGMCPKLYINIFHPQYDDLFILGMVEATGVGFQGRYDQADLVARYILNLEKPNHNFKKFKFEKSQNNTDLTKGRKYLKLERMAFYVDKEIYLKKLRSSLELLETDSQK